MSQELKNPHMIWSAAYGLAGAYEKLDQPAPALQHYKLAIAEIEKVRARAGSDEGKSKFFERKTVVYQDLIRLLIAGHRQDPAAGHLAEAFHYAERARARALLDLTAEARVNVEQDVDADLLDRRRDIEARMAEAQAQLIKRQGPAPPDRAKVKALEADLAQADEDYQSLRREMRRRHPRYAELRDPDPVRLEQAQSLLSEGALLLEYVLGDEASFLFAVSRTECLVALLPPERDLSARVKKLRQLISRGPHWTGLANYLTQAQSLYRDLIQPAGRLLAGKRELIVVADGVLHYLPFEVLLKPGGADRAQIDLRQLPYLVRDYSISYVSSASVLSGLSGRHAERPRAQKMFLAYADPVYGEGEQQVAGATGSALRRAFAEGTPWELRRLAQSRKEVERIAKLFPGGEASLFLGEQASEDNVKTGEGLGQHRIIHFAVHGLLNENRPQFSGLVLSRPAARGGTAGAPAQDGLLQVYEIFNLRLQADLVVLSACETGLGPSVRGEGLIGLTRAFLYAGTPAVVVSLWKVEDRSTAELMARFYRHLRGPAVSKAEALRRAQLDLIRAGRFGHPYFWAAFVLFGKS